MLPSSYVSLLREVGWGAICECTFQIYSGPVEASDIFDQETAKLLSDYLFIGDDFAGGMIAYHVTSDPWRLTSFEYSRFAVFDDRGQKDLAEFLCTMLSG
jgi:hypothetical protein